MNRNFFTSTKKRHAIKNLPTYKKPNFKIREKMPRKIFGEQIKNS